MLTQLYEGQEKSNFILIKESSVCSAQDFFLAFVNKALVKCDRVHVFLFENPPSHFETFCFKESRHKLTIHDFYSDPLGWLNPTGLGFPHNFDILKLVNESRDKNQNSAIIIDSLSPMLRHCDFQKVCFLLQDACRFYTKESVFHRLVCLFRYDLHDDNIRLGLEYLADTVAELMYEGQLVNVRRSKKSVQNLNKVCKLSYKKSSGKAVESLETFTILHGTITDIKPWTASAGEEGGSGADDPAANLTFDLNLSDKEKSERSKLVMPYLKPRHLEVKMDEAEDRPPASSEDGLIYYEPDDADDFDEEDPDDDLDF